MNSEAMRFRGDHQGTKINQVTKGLVEANEGIERNDGVTRVIGM